MKKTKWVVAAFALAVAIVALALWHQSKPVLRSDAGSVTEEPADPGTASDRGGVIGSQHQIIGDTDATDSPQVAQAPTQSDEQPVTDERADPARKLLAELSRTYETGVLPVRIRLQDQLSRYWEDNPPSADKLVGLVGDQSLPAELRMYLARTFANRVKMRAYTDEEKAAAFAELREMVTSEDEDSLLRAELANVLTTIDDSDAAVEAVAGLLDDGNPQAVQKAVAALTHTTNSLAIEAAYEFVQDDERLLNENPTALLAALAPLSTTDKDVTPMLDRIVRQTDDFKLYAGAVQCLIHAKPTVAVLESIAQAYTESKRFPQHAAQAEQMCRAAARRNERFFRAQKTKMNTGTVNAFDQLLRTETGR